MLQILNEKMMRDFGRFIGEELKGGEVIELVGDVGAGKTTFVRGLADGIGIEEAVQSPSFTISRVYDSHGKRLAHYDFYRLSDAGIMADELDEVIHDPQTSIVIEWADAVRDVVPEDKLTLTIAVVDEDTRTIEIHSQGNRAHDLERRAYAFTA